MDRDGLKTPLNRRVTLKVLDLLIKSQDSDDEDEVLIQKTLTDLKAVIQENVFVKKELTFTAFTHCLKHWTTYFEIDKWVLSLEENGYTLNDVEAFLDTKDPDKKDIGIIHRFLQSYDYIPDEKSKYYNMFFKCGLRLLIRSKADDTRKNKEGLNIYEVVAKIPKINDFFDSFVDSEKRLGNKVNLKDSNEEKKI